MPNFINSLQIHKIHCNSNCVKLRTVFSKLMEDTDASHSHFSLFTLLHAILTAPVIGNFSSQVIQLAMLAGLPVPHTVHTSLLASLTLA